MRPSNRALFVAVVVLHLTAGAVNTEATVLAQQPSLAGTLFSLAYLGAWLAYGSRLGRRRYPRSLRALTVVWGCFAVVALAGFALFHAGAAATYPAGMLLPLLLVGVTAPLHGFVGWLAGDAQLLEYAGLAGFSWLLVLTAALLGRTRAARA
jgi:hypothetical protein